MYYTVKGFSFVRAERDRVARGPEREVLKKVFTALLAFTRSLEVQERRVNLTVVAMKSDRCLVGWPGETVSFRVD